MKNIWINIIALLLILLAQMTFYLIYLNTQINYTGIKYLDQPKIFNTTLKACNETICGYCYNNTSQMENLKNFSKLTKLLQ